MNLINTFYKCKRINSSAKEISDLSANIKAMELLFYSMKSARRIILIIKYCFSKTISMATLPSANIYLDSTPKQF